MSYTVHNLICKIINVSLLPGIAFTQSDVAFQTFSAENSRYCTEINEANFLIDGFKIVHALRQYFELRVIVLISKTTFIVTVSTVNIFYSSVALRLKKFTREF